MLVSESADNYQLRPGDLVRDTYVVERKLGDGAFGTVYRVRHRILGLQALKLFRSDTGIEAGDLNQEALVLSRLLHPNIIRVFEANVLDGSGAPRPYMTMEYIDGGTLEDLLSRRVRLDVADAVTIATQIALALSIGHRLNPPLVHRDVKPQNVLLADESDVRSIRLGDFGLARHLDPDSRMTRAAGTIHYLAPESTWGYHTEASDVYSAGVVLYRMLTGMFPFPFSKDLTHSTAAEARATLAEARHGRPQPPSRFRLDLPRSLDSLVLAALEPEPGNRPRNGTELAQALTDRP